VLRADGFGATGGSCSGSGVIVNNNLFYVDAPLRNPALLNTIGSGWPAGGFDFPATIQNLAGSATAHNTPGLACVGGVPYLIGTNFASQYVAGPAGAGAVGVQAGHLAAGVADHRGNISYCEKNFAPLGSTSGVAAIIGQVAGVSNTINLWGLGATGNVTGTLALTLPAVLVDATNGATNLAGVNALDHYHSQVAFQGGNGQIALNVDHQGNLLVAAVVDQPADTGADHAEHYIAVARVTPAGAVSWTMAAYNVSSLGAKPYLDGPGGAVVGRLSDLGLVTGGAPAGPSMSAPMLDSFGNVYFFSAIENLVSGNFATALLRAVYSPASFSYELERIFTVGEVFRGQNTGLDYQIRFVAIADSNSVSSATLWSQNALSQGFGGQTHYGLPGVDPKHLGGLVLGAEIVYDWDNDGSFDKVTGVGGDPASFDQEYNVLLFVGPTDSCQLSLGVGQGPGDANLTVCGTGLGLGETSTVRLSRVSPNVPTFAVLSLPGFPNLPIAGGTVISGFGLVPGSPNVVTANGAGEVLVPLVGSAVPNSLLLQFLAVDFTQPPLGPGLPGLEFSNAVLLRFGN
jgi:hypothetical protein